MVVLGVVAVCMMKRYARSCCCSVSAPESAQKCCYILLLRLKIPILTSTINTDMNTDSGSTEDDQDLVEVAHVAGCGKKTAAAALQVQVFPVIPAGVRSGLRRRGYQQQQHHHHHRDANQHKHHYQHQQQE
jgi:hypothetical protein